MVRAVARRPVTVAVPPILAWQEAVERVEQILVGAGADLDDHHARSRVRDEHRQQAVAIDRDVGHETGAVCGQVDEATPAPRPDRQLASVYGKMLRIASRSRPSPPPTGADS